MYGLTGRKVIALPIRQITLNQINYMNKLVFIISLPRSGSTLLQKLLLAHNSVATSSENWLLLTLCYSLYEKDVFTPYNHQLASTGMADFLKTTGLDSYDEFIRSFANAAFSKLCDSDDQVVVDKTPRNYLIVPHLARIFPDAKFIILKRNPIQVFASILSSWRQGRFRYHYRDWIDLNEGPKFLADSIGQLRDRSVIVDYEDLVKSPAKELSDILSFLDLPLEPGLLAKFNPQENLGELGDKSNKYQAVSQESIESWKLQFHNFVRKRVAKRYLLELQASGVLSGLGYDINKSLAELEVAESSSRGNIRDLWDIFVSNLIRRLNLNLVLKVLFIRQLRDRFYA